MANPSFYPEGSRILPSDNEMRTLHKIAALNGAGSGSSPGSGVAGLQQVYIDRYPTAPDNRNFPALSFASGGGPMVQWDVASQTWV